MAEDVFGRVAARDELGAFAGPRAAAPCNSHVVTTHPETGSRPGQRHRPPPQEFCR